MLGTSVNRFVEALQRASSVAIRVANDARFAQTNWSGTFMADPRWRTLAREILIPFCLVVYGADAGCMHARAV